jgi:hypothetical protein
VLFRSQLGSARARCPVGRTGNGVRVLVHEAKLEVVVGDVGRRWAASEGVRRSRRRTVLTELEDEVASFILALLG